MTLNLDAPPAESELKPKLVVIGVGGAGGNAINNMIEAGLEGVDFVVANTDSQALKHSKATKKIQLGAKRTQGLGAGGNPEEGEEAALESEEEIRDVMEGAHMVFIAAGMGGGTGTGAAPVIANIARQLNALTVAVVTKPFIFEGKVRQQSAKDGLKKLQSEIDSLIVIPNHNLFRVATNQMSLTDAFKMADEILHKGVRGITDLMVNPGLMNLDFADVRTVMKGMGNAMMGTGESEGENRAVDAAENAISNPLLDDTSLKGAKSVLVNISGSQDFTILELNDATARIQQEIDENANIILGSSLDETLGGRVRVTIIATGIEGVQEEQVSNVAAKATEDQNSDEMQRKNAEIASRFDPITTRSKAPEATQQGLSQAVAEQEETITEETDQEIVEDNVSDEPVMENNAELDANHRQDTPEQLDLFAEPQEFVPENIVSEEQDEISRLRANPQNSFTHKAVEKEANENKDEMDAPKQWSFGGLKKSFLKQDEDDMPTDANSSSSTMANSQDMAGIISRIEETRTLAEERLSQQQAHPHSHNDEEQVKRNEEVIGDKDDNDDQQTVDEHKLSIPAFLRRQAS